MEILKITNFSIGEQSNWDVSQKSADFTKNHSFSFQHHFTTNDRILAFFGPLESYGAVDYNGEENCGEIFCFRFKGTRHVHTMFCSEMSFSMVG